MNNVDDNMLADYVATVNNLILNRSILNLFHHCLRVRPKCFPPKHEVVLYGSEITNDVVCTNIVTALS